MEIRKTKNKLIIELSLWQSNYDAIGQPIEDAPNLVGIIAGEEYSISQMIALGYKDDLQEGMPIVMFDDKDELVKICKDFRISLWEYPICNYCNKPIRGSFTYGKKGNMCFSCELNTRTTASKVSKAKKKNSKEVKTKRKVGKK